MKSKSFMLMILSMGFGLIAAIGISQVMGRSNGKEAVAAPTAPVLVAKADLEHNAFLTEENVSLENWPLEIVPENAANSLEQITDMASRQALNKGMPIVMTTLVHKKQINDINIPVGSNVMAIKVDEDGTIHGLMKPGDKVNVIGFFKSKDGSGQVSKTFLKGLRVWSVNAQRTAQSGTREETSSKGSAIVGLLVTERQAEAIVHVQRTGSLQLVLRGDQVEEGDGDTLNSDVFGMSGATEQTAAAVTVESNAPEDSQTKSQTKSQTSGFSLFGGTKKVVESSMVIWNGSEPQKVLFQDGKLPDSSFRRPTPGVKPGPPVFVGPAPPETASTPVAPVNPATPDASVKSDSFDDRDRGLEEDQYQGE